MSNEIIAVHTITNHLTISNEGAKWLEGKGEQDEWSMSGAFFLDRHPEYVRRGPTNRVTMDWSGEGSRDSMVDGGLAKFARFTSGLGEFILIAEDGTLFGLRIKDGGLAWHHFDIQLTEPCPPPKNRWREEDG